LKEPGPLAKLTVFKERNVGWDKTHLFSSFERIHSRSIINYYKILWNPIEVTGASLTLPWKLNRIGQGCRKKSYSGTLSLSPDSNNVYPLEGLRWV
jgi:hypothetical protein